MENYFINNETLILRPLSLDQTKIIELDKEFIINQNIMSIVNNSCCYFGSSYAGRYQGSKKILNMSYKLPIILEDYNEMIIFPTCSSKKEDCCWLLLNNIENYSKDNRNTIVEFKNKKIENINISFGSFENQIFRATLLLTKMRKRKK